VTEHVATFAAQAICVTVQTVDYFLASFVIDPGQDRRIRKQAPGAVYASLGRLCKQCCIGLTLRNRKGFSHDSLSLRINLHQRIMPARMQVEIPDVQNSRRLQTLHTEPVSFDASHDGYLTLTAIETVLSGSHIDACRKALQIPFPRSKSRLIKIVQVEEYFTFRRAV
jgi:hypothetical protein